MSLQRQSPQGVQDTKKSTRNVVYPFYPPAKTILPSYSARIPTFGATVSPFVPGMRFVGNPDFDFRYTFSTLMVFGDYIYTATTQFGDTGIAGFFVNAIYRFTGVDNPTWPAGGAPVPIYPSAGHTLAEALNTAEFTTSMTAVDDGKDSLIFISVTNSGFDAFQRGGVSAFDLNGKLVWSEIIEPNAGAGTGSWSTPAFDTERKLMFFGTTNQKDLPASDESSALQARYYKTGKLAWNYQYVPGDIAGNAYPHGIYGNPTYMMDRDVGSSPNVFDVCCNGKNRKLVGSCGKDGVYRAIDRKHGTLAWQTILSTTPTLWGNPSSAYHNGIIYAVTSSDIDLELVGNADPAPYQSYSQLILGNGQQFAALKSWLYSNGIIAALDACTGKILWKKEFPSLFWAGATYANGMIYMGSYDGTIRVLDAVNGDVLFSGSTLSQIVPPGVPVGNGAPIQANITVSNGVIYMEYSAFLTTTAAGILALTPSSLCSSSAIVKPNASISPKLNFTDPKRKDIVNKLMTNIKNKNKYKL